ncbi:hypothetical protein [Streptomyces sp. f51]|uniref:hypothetical protein n=1 Tax=Streptomyces sp. f51 TaxID=1827742 RepID=UPI00359FF381
MISRWRRVVSPSSSAALCSVSPLPGGGAAVSAAGGAGGRAVYPVASTVAIRSSTDTSAPA